MTSNYLLENIQILEGSGSSSRKESVLIKNGVINAFGEKAIKKAEQIGIKPQKAKNMLLAPCLVDPHSFLESPFSCLLYTSPSPRDLSTSRMPSSA